MRNIFLIISTMLLVNSLQANESKVCQKCHPIIYSEYYESSHRKASVYNNPIHKAMWDKHPKDEKGYTCAKCHSPSDLESLQTGKLTENDIQTQEPISCTYCHTIKDVEEGDSSNTNISNGKKREYYTAEKGIKGKAEYKTETSWFGLVKESKSSPFHKIDYDNENYYSGNVCMGCHSHTNNEHSFDITMLDAAISDKDENTCVTCHMPQVLGTKVTIHETKTHAYHGIAGIYHKQKKMGEHIDFKISKTNNNFNVEVINKSNHALFGQAFRQGILKAEIKRNGKTIELEPFIFERILAKDGKEVMPWDANEAIKDTLIYAKRNVVFEQAIKAGDVVTLTLGVQRISDNGAKKLGIEDNKELTKFRVMKTEKYSF
ncbi:MAG: cytochrome c family protein [Sulfurimonas sp.]|uniref:multiheme c-type cytochrome n=1 Tax=Sulfurimonas sp. TaxID=2022749 RepID=UPI00260C13B5|nr:multiheme c-type cytochrome [Sulfurimonas sp.]MCW8894306.1 cytochrome c family protein [Sulfurimonas sp.]MCW8953953.1 cytochrome c family protein [Sulfurimonas sp.]MCW9068004.1 cytochrome c family protein [Sulfurimonas sp.]